MAGGLGGLGGFDFGNVLGALGQSLLTSPRENPFQGLPQALQNNAKQREHQAELLALSTVAEKLGVPKELAASPQAMQLFIQHINQTKLNQLRQQAAQGTSLIPPSEDATSQPAMSVPGLQGSTSGLSTEFNVAGGLGGGGGIGGPPGGAAPAFGEGAGRSGRPLTLRQGALSGPAVEKGRAVFNGLVARGLSPIAAASITGNIRGESAFNTAAIGDQGTSGGLAQWHNERWTALKQRAAQQGKPWTDLDVQLDHLVSELKGSERGALAAVNAARNPQEGALAFMRGFERPSKKAMAESGPLRASAAASALNLYGGGANQVASAAPLPPARPTQLASNDPNMPLPSRAMQRVMDEAVAKGVGQNTSQNAGQNGPSIGQSGAGLNQVAAGGSRTIPVPIQTTLPPAPVISPPVNTGTGDTKTKAWARAEFQRGMNLLAASNGDSVLMKQAEIIMQRAAKYGDPSDTARRVSEAGLTGTPVGRAIIGGLPQGVIEKLTEQQVPGYEAPGTLEQKKFRSAEEERQSQREFRERQFANTVGQQSLEFNQREAARRQQRELAEKGHTIAQQTEAERLGMGLAGPRAAQVRTGLEAKADQAAAEARARDVAAAQTKFATEATGGAQAAEALAAPVKQAQQHLENVVKMGGYGPVAASRVSRALNAVVPDIPGLKPGHTAEVERQRFDQAMASIGAAKAALINKQQGGGNMSLTEQVLARADLATLTAADPEVARGAFRKLNEDIDRAAALDKRFGIFQGEQQTPREREGAAPTAQAAPAPSKDGWIDFGNGVRVRRK